MNAELMPAHPKQQELIGHLLELRSTTSDRVTEELFGSPVQDLTCRQANLMVYWLLENRCH